MNATERKIETYTVTCSVKRGKEAMDVEVKTSQGPDAAGRRAMWTLISTREYGDVDEIDVVEVVTGTFEDQDGTSE